MTALLRKIVVDREEEKKFRRRAIRRYPKEYLETLWGYVRGDVVYVCVFMPIEQYATKNSVSINNEHLDEQEDEALDHKLELLGTIHTHPDSDATISEGDIRSYEETQEFIIGVCSIINNGKRKQCTTNYWPRIMPLPIEYRDRRSQSEYQKAVA